MFAVKYMKMDLCTDKSETDVRIEQLQVAIFYPGIAISDKIKVAQEMRSTCGLDGEVVILPVPDEAPYEILRIQLFSKDQVFSVLIAKNRADLLFRPGASTATGRSFPPTYASKVFALFAYMRDILQARVTRVGIVGTWQINLGNRTSITEVTTRYVRESLSFPGIHDVELHFLTKERIDEFLTNRWVGLRTVQDTPKAGNLVSLMIDLNTVAEVEYSFTHEKFEGFFRKGQDLIMRTLGDHLKIMGVSDEQF
ncbi:MAG: hypothetical protein ABIM21_01350 [candidate division WOR-3 bacterium]